MPQEQETTAPAPVTQPVAAPDVRPPTASSELPAAPNHRIDQYDLGDTGIFVDTGSSPPPIEPTVEDKTPRQRNELGQFLPVEPSSVPPGTAAQKHSEYSVLQAKDLGFSDDEINSATPDQLAREIYLVTRKLRQETRTDTRADAIEGHGKPPTVPGGTPDQKEPDFDWGEGPEYDDGVATGKTVKYKDDMIAAPLVNVIKRQDKALAELKAQVSQLLGVEQSRQKEAFFTEIDQMFVSKPEIFGDKAGSQMKPDDPLFQKRGAIVLLMNAMKSGSAKERWNKAVKMVYGDAAPPSQKPPQTPQAESASRITPEQWAGSALPRPTHRNGAPEPAGVDRAAKNMEAKLRELESTDDEAADKDFRP